MDATLDERARRRQAELRARGLEADFGTVRGEIGRRDVQDTTRVLAPLRKADDAIEVDTSELTIDQVVERMLAEVERRRGGAGRSEEHTSELQSLAYLVCRLLLEKKKNSNSWI